MDVKTAHSVQVTPFEVFGRRYLQRERDGKEESERVRYSPCWNTEGFSEGEHELYFSGKRVVWSVGGILRQTLQVEHEVVDCNWASFQPLGSSSSSSDHNQNLCVLTQEGFTSYCGGEAFTISLPMRVSKLWKLARGILLQETESSKVWFLGSSLSELTEVVMPLPQAADSDDDDKSGDGDGGGGGGLSGGGGRRTDDDAAAAQAMQGKKHHSRICFTSTFSEEPYIICFNQERKEHEVYKYTYKEEVHVPNSVPTLVLERVPMFWSSYQYPEPASWIDFVLDAHHQENNNPTMKAYLLQRKTNQLIAFSLPRQQHGKRKQTERTTTSLGEEGTTHSVHSQEEEEEGKTSSSVEECFSITAVSATSITPLHMHNSSSNKDKAKKKKEKPLCGGPLKPVGLVVLTPESDVNLHFGSWCVCKIGLNMGGGDNSKNNSTRDSRHIKRLCHTLQSKFVAELDNGTSVCVSTQLGPAFSLTSDAMSALDAALPTELYREVFGVFIASKKSVFGSQEEEWRAFQYAFSDLVEAREEDGGAVVQQMEVGGQLNGDATTTATASSSSSSSEWDCLLNSDYHQEMLRKAPHALAITRQQGEDGEEKGSAARNRKGFQSTGATTRKLSKTQLWHILEALHALYEDCRLDMTKWSYIPSLLLLLGDLTHLIGNEAELYKARYQLDAMQAGMKSVREYRSQQYSGGEVRHYPADMFRALECLIKSTDYSPWLPTLLQYQEARFLSWSRKLLRLYESINKHWSNSLPQSKKGKSEESDFKGVVEVLVEDSWSVDDMQRLPFGLLLPIQEIIMRIRENPDLDWPCEIYMVLNRQDLAANCVTDDGALLNFPYSLGLWPQTREEEEQKVEYNVKNSSVSASNKAAAVSADGTNNADDGMSGIDIEFSRLRFSHDLRLKEVRKILSSSYPRQVQLPKGMDLSHPETNNVQQTKLHEMSMKTMALSMGRGAFSLGTLTPLPTEPFNIPELTLSGILPHQNNALITLDMNNLKSQNLLIWPQFHNGVAAGLQLAKGQAQLTRTWIVYNKAEEPSSDHAGFLMALGLQGHLGCLSITDIYRYLSQEDDMTTIGVLLGVSAANIGKMDTTISKMLFLHIPARHPAHYPELELSSLIQAAALVGVGLLYLESSHRIMTEVLLEEIVRKPNTDNWRDQEGYALAAGIGLGLVNLGRGSSTTGISDMNLEDKLCYFMNGGATHKYSNGGSKGMPKTNSSAGQQGGSSAQVMEDNLVNLNVTSPAAAYALGLMYLQTNDKTVASRFSNPESNFALDFIRPDFILLRVLFKSLIMWDQVHATHHWVEDQIPKFLRNAVKEDGSVQISGEYESDLYDVDLHTIAQCHVYALTGASVALGVRFAGTSNKNAKAILTKNILTLLRFKSKSPDIALVHTSMCNRANKPTLEQCTCMMALALSLIMAGSGDLETFRLLRALHNRDSTKSVRMTYATSMSLSMAIGFLFLGGGQLSFNTSRKSVAAILISIFPHFPASTSDNRSHLQAFRHLYVMAVENRCIEAIDVESWENIHCPLEVEVVDGPESYTCSCVTPTILPEMSKIKSISVQEGTRYWPGKIKLNNNNNEDKEEEKYGAAGGGAGGGGSSSSENSKLAIIVPRALLEKRRIYVKKKDKSLPRKTVNQLTKICTDPFIVGFANLMTEHNSSVDADDAANDEEEEQEFRTFCKQVLYENMEEALMKLYLGMKVLSNQLVAKASSYGKLTDSTDLLNLWSLNMAHAWCTFPGVFSGKSMVDHGFVRKCWSETAKALDLE
jgi:anaphase-promoting complex subunit 1